jgi:V8-like Glu-specific endopeptidase
MIAPANAARADEPESLEKVFGNSPFMPFAAWAMALGCAQSVCRVEDKLNQGIGTGFIVNGRLLHKKLPNEAVLITNAHVLSPKGDGGSLTASQAHVAFYGNTGKGGRPHTSPVKKIVWSSDPEKFDCTIALLGTPPKVKAPLSVAANLPVAASKQKVYVIGHPSGGGLMFSLNDNELLDHGDPGDHRVHYRTPTEPGSSGSPVFNGQWELIALHHAGDVAMDRIHGAGTYEANEGIALKHIVPAIKV